jgi:3-phytase
LVIATSVGCRCNRVDCQQDEIEEPGAADADRVEPVEIMERLETSRDATDNVDSVAVAPEQSWIIATSKGTHCLIVADGSTGEIIRRVGSAGSEPGSFLRPNGIAVAGDLVLVVERDNARVQVLRLPGLETIGLVGEEELQRPYGIAVMPSSEPAEGGTTLDLFVTDNLRLSEDDLQASEMLGDPRLGERVKRYRLSLVGDTFTSEHIATFGDIDGDGALLTVESIAVDPVHDRLLIADEHGQRKWIAVYRTDGTFTGTLVGEAIFTAEPEGIVLWRCGDRGYWLTTDQHADRTVFELFDRVTLDPVGSFVGATTANTDGIGLTQEGLPSMPSGAFYAVHDDQSISGFDLRDIASALRLEHDCSEAPGA